MWIVGIFAVIVGVLYAFVFDVWTVPSDDPAMLASIAPTLGAGDVVLVSRHAGATERGFLLRCADPDAPGRFVIAREVALAGENVAIHGDSVSVDRVTQSTTACDTHKFTIENPATHEPTELDCYRTDTSGMTHDMLRGSGAAGDDVSVTVDGGRIYLVSDDIHFHDDSRDYGQIAPGTCQHLVFRLQGGTGFGDSARRFTLLW